MFVYKINPIDEFKKLGYSSSKLQTTRGKDGKFLFGASQTTKMKKGYVVGIDTLDKMCEILGKQPSDIIEWMPYDRYVALKESGYFDKKGIPTPPIGEEKMRYGKS